MFSLSACFQIAPQKKIQELLGSANEEAMAHFRNEKSLATETNSEVQ
jgi:hypothetical protein